MVAIARSRALFPVLLAAMILWPSLTAAQAKDDDGGETHSIYFNLQGGWAIMHNSEVSRFSSFYTVEPDAEAAFDSGATVSGAIGVTDSKKWRIELEAIHWSNQFDDIQWNRFFKFGNFATSGEIETLAYMANFVFIGEIEQASDFNFYVGVGIGVAHFKLKNVSDSDGALFSGSDTSFAGQFFLGVEYPVTENVAVTLGYRIFGSAISTHADTGQPEIGGDRVRFPVSTSSLLAGISFKF